MLIDTEVRDTLSKNHSNIPNISFDNSSKGVGIAVVDINIGDEITCDYRSFDEGSKENLGFIEE